MVHDHFLDHQSKRGAKVMSWFLLAMLIGLFMGFFAHGANGQPLQLYSLRAGVL